MFHESREKCPLSVPNLGERKRTHRLPFGEDGAKRRVGPIPYSA